ncbi:MAG: hypothetical protein E7648_02185 [Ruminococcaceae bacterium]|nr:hypothetical protein [Oscillospiraceae bacterium]
MNENNVISELQAASKWYKEHGRNTNTAIVGICDRAIDHINRQKAEIERLNHIVDANKMVGAEAVKEFAEKLKKKSHPFPCAIGVEHAVTLRAINDLLKEFEEKNAK